MSRLAPLDPPFDDATAATFDRLMGGVDAPPLALFRLIAHHPQLLERFRQLGSTLLGRGSLPADERETLIHRTTARCGAAYEWGVHAAAFAPALGLDDAWLRATWSGTPDPHAFSDRQRTLVRVADALHDTGALDDATAAALDAGWSPEAQVEIVCLCGFYHLVAFLCGAFALPPEPWAVTPPGS